ncbi:MAG: hypothetical protein ACFFCV_12665 [Promethearchaeota archaeon]
MDFAYKIIAIFQKNIAKIVRNRISIKESTNGYRFLKNKALLISFRDNPNSLPILYS